MKLFLSRLTRAYKRYLKKGGAWLAVALFRSKSYQLFGIPAGLNEVEGSLKKLTPLQKVDWLPYPRIGPYLHKKFARRKELKFKPTSCFVLKEGVATALGGHLNSRAELITTHLTLSGGTDVSKHELFNFSFSRFFPKILRVESPVASLTMAWQGAFYHWMWQVLPRLSFVNKNDLIFIDRSCPFQRESLQLLGFTNFVDASQYDAVASPEITVISTSNTGSTPDACHFLRTSFLPLLNKGEKKRLYISRADAKTRRLKNEEQIWELLKPLGYEKVILSEFSLLEQMSLFHSAKEIVSTHGAALSHLVFCDPKTKVIEIFHKNYVNLCYCQVASLVSLDYIPLFDTTSSSLEDPDITVELRHLRQALDYSH